MKKRHAILLITVLAVISVSILLIAIFVMPSIAEQTAQIHPEVGFLQYPVLLGIYATVIPFLYAIAKTVFIVMDVQKGEYGSSTITESLQHIQYCAWTIITIYIAGFVMIVTANAMPPLLALLGIVILLVTLLVATGANFLRATVQKMNVTY